MDKVCSRCERKADAVALVFSVRGGLALPTLASEPATPRAERVCAMCLTPTEIARNHDVASLVVLALNCLIANATDPRACVPLETAKAYFMIRNNDPDEGSERRARGVAMRIMGWRSL